MKPFSVRNLLDTNKAVENNALMPCWNYEIRAKNQYQEKNDNTNPNQYLYYLPKYRIFFLYHIKPPPKNLADIFVF
jgi:hypothetical protein